MTGVGDVGNLLTAAGFSLPTGMKEIDMTRREKKKE
jgi:hypothetical protein